VTDLETMKAMLTRAKIEFEETTEAPRIAARPADDEPAKIILQIEDGYPGFYSRVSFSLDGALTDFEAFE
jgi:hypothetical protein